MKKFVSLLISFLLISFLPISATAADTQQEIKVDTTPLFISTETNAILIDIPSNWSLPNASVKLPPHVLLLTVGQGQHPFPPSLNVAAQPYKGTIKQYLKNVKAINEARGDEWKDLGNIRTESGSASLSQVNSKSEWGETRSMHVILLKNEQIYILTASALKDEFPKFYKEFFASMRSIRIGKDASDLLESAPRKTQLIAAIQNVQQQWQTEITQQQKTNPETSLDAIKEQVFNNEEFKTKTWLPFKEVITQKFADMGAGWQNFIFEKTENDLFDAPS